MKGRPAPSRVHPRLHYSSLMICRTTRLRRCLHQVAVVLGVAVVTCCCRGGQSGVEAIELTIDADMVQNMQSANETESRFSSTDYVDLTCKVDYSILDGPGAHLTNGIFLGDTVARETFVTQFVLDISSAANISPSRVYVMEIAPGWVHHDWEANNVIILFRLVDNVVAGTSGEDGMVTVMAELTAQAQERGSALYGGLVTDRIDPKWGVVAVNLDVSLRLTTAIEVIGGDEVQEGYYLNQGARGWCDYGRSVSDPNITESDYCQWEAWFIGDVSGCLEILDPDRVRVLFVKRAAADAVLVHFRIGEPSNYTTEIAVNQAAAELLVQLQNTSSALFAGNVTATVDPSWGLSGDGGVPRERSPYLPHQVYADHRHDDYERCKDVHRCNRAWVHYDTNTRTVNFTTQAFRDGLHVPASLFADFEDWRMGTFGWTIRGAPDPRHGDYFGIHGGGSSSSNSSNGETGEASITAPRGGHFDPRNFSSLGPQVPLEARGLRTFSGLVLDQQQKDRELARLDIQAAQLSHKLDWTIENRETATLDAFRRSREDAAAAADDVTDYVQSELSSVLDTRQGLNSTQCLGWQTCSGTDGEDYGSHSYKWWADVNGSMAPSLRGENASCPCTIVFNTSSLSLDGAISAVGELALTAQGTEVAVWSFDQVYLGPEITVEVTGQRALAILSRGSLVLNTSITAQPSTLGGFPGGGGIARDPGVAGDLLLSPPSLPPEFDLSSLAGGTLEGAGVGGTDVPSYNVNGPGAASYRYYLFTITTSADDVDEVQKICTSADEGQTLRGCFHISFGSLFTECVPHDATASALQTLIEGGLNAEPVDSPGPLPYPRSGGGGTGAGAGAGAVGGRGSGESGSLWGPGVGRVNVSADGPVDDAGGRCWVVTFSSAIGAVGPLTVSPASTSSSPLLSSTAVTASAEAGDDSLVTNRLTGLGATVSVETVRAGNTISGSFLIKFRGGGGGGGDGEDAVYETAQLSATASAVDVAEALLKLPGVALARATRSVPVTAAGGVAAVGCSDGLCRDGPAPGGGLEWVVELGTRVGNAEPWSPIAAVAGWTDKEEAGGGGGEGAFDWPEVDGSNLEGKGAAVSVRKGWAGAAEQLAASFNASQPFSFALGGVGASHGGAGGLGADQSPVSGAPRQPYSSPSIHDLLGGSGGARSGLSAAAVNALGSSETSGERRLRGLGGAGGGAVELAALNDVTIGVLGSVSADGGDGAEDWDGGGGGGSGGSVVVAAGGALRHAGVISARGGNGGRTLRPLSRNGGGGGAGGRVALYGQSVEVIGGGGGGGEEGGGALAENAAVVDVGGGSCFVTTRTGELRDDACGNGRAGEEGTIKIDAAVGYTFGIDDGSGLGGAGAQGTNSSLLLSRHNGAISTSSGQPFQAFRSFDGPEYVIDGGGTSPAALSTPERVTFYVKVAATAREGSTETSSGHASAAEWGVIFALLGPGENASTSTSSYNASDWEEQPNIANSTESSSISSSSDWSPAGSLFPAPRTTLVGISISGGAMKHGAGYHSIPSDPGEEQSAAGGSGGLLDDRVEGGRWYKVDIMMRWDDGGNGTAGEYDVLVDGVAKAENQRFGSGRYSTSGSSSSTSGSDSSSSSSDGGEATVAGGGVERVGLYILGEGRAWFDEIYLGPDFTMGFQCPKSSRRGVETRNSGSLKRWESLVDVGHSKNKVMQRHENFLYNTEKYQINHGGLVPFDGDGMREYLVDNYVQDIHDSPLVEGLRAGSLLNVPRGEDFIGKRALHEGSARNLHGDGLWSSDEYSDGSSSRSSSSQHAAGTHYWYGEHEVAKRSSIPVDHWEGQDEFDDWTGGVGACSTDDFVDWRFEGIMLHYANVSDMVLGREPEGGMIVQQPKTLRLENTSASSNSSTGLGGGGDSADFPPEESPDTYVMWMGAGESNGTFGMSAVATSGYPDGPFSFRRTLYPDGNETHDQTAYIGADGRGYLARTYYVEIEYVLPGAIMQPVWSSVKRPDGSVNFGLSYHRAFYSPDYDDYHDIYMQRWRLEDVPWEITCVNRITGESRDVPYGDFNADRGYCNQPEEYKVVVGQGYPVVRSRFQDPTDKNNSLWSPDSVPSVKAQSWEANYRDGLCGIREMDEGIDENDPGLDDRSPTNRSACSNIADNPIHGTVPDKLIGKKIVVETRIAKYVAVSRLTRDLLDTSAVLSSFEGELGDRDDLMALVSGSEFDGFDWSAGTGIGSTFHPQVNGEFETAPDVLTRFNQYESSENDRARYSLACQLDGTCPVNFRDQISVGQT